MELFAIILIGLIAFLFGWLSGSRFIHANTTANIEDLQRQIADLTKTVNEQKDKANGC